MKERYKYDKNGIRVQDGNVLRYDNGRIKIAKIPQDYIWMNPRSKWRHKAGGLTIVSSQVKKDLLNN